MASKKDDSKGILGIENMIRGLQGIAERLRDLEEHQGQFRREGTLGDKGEQGIEGVYGFSVRLGVGGEDRGVRVKPFGNFKQERDGATTVVDEREPLVDLFDESDHVLVVAELPGVEEADVFTELRGDVLVLGAEARDRNYRTEVLLPDSFEDQAMSRSMRNGILEVRLSRA